MDLKQSLSLEETDLMTYYSTDINCSCSRTSLSQMTSGLKISADLCVRMAVLQSGATVQIHLLDETVKYCSWGATPSSSGWRSSGGWRLARQVVFCPCCGYSAALESDFGC